MESEEYKPGRGLLAAQSKLVISGPMELRRSVQVDSDQQAPPPRKSMTTRCGSPRRTTKPKGELKAQLEAPPGQIMRVLPGGS